MSGPPRSSTSSRASPRSPRRSSSTSGWRSASASGCSSRPCAAAARHPSTPRRRRVLPTRALPRRAPPRAAGRPPRLARPAPAHLSLGPCRGLLRGALRLSPRQAAKELVVFLQGRGAGPRGRARRRRPCSRALRQPSGHRRVDRAPADRHPLQLHRPRQRPLRGARRCSTARPPTRASWSRSPSTTAGCCSSVCPSAARVEVVHCGVDLERHAWRGLRRPRSRPASCAWRAFRRRRATLHLSTRLPLLAERRPGIVLELVGDGPERERILARARERGVADRVRLLGALSSEDVRAMLAEAQGLRRCPPCGCRAAGWRASPWR